MAQEKVELPRKKSGGLVLLIIALAGLLILAAARFLLNKTAEPLGPALALPTLASSPDPLPQPTLAEPEESAVASLAAPASTPVVEAPVRALPILASPTPGPTAEPVCGGPPSMLVLAIGADSGTYLYGLADVIRIARLDYVNERITIVSLPRDLWVAIPGISSKYGYTHGKINQAYLFGNPGMDYYRGPNGEPAPAGGPGLLALTIQHNFGLTVDHYGAVNLDVFVRMIDAVGGVDVVLPEPVDGRDASGAGPIYSAGKHHFDGTTALSFARIRYRYSDFKRQDNQSLILAALREKVLSPAVLPRIPSLIEAFEDQVKTDLSPEMLLQALCLVERINPENIVMTQLPRELYTAGWIYNDSLHGDVYIQQADPAEIGQYLALFAAGQWP